MYIKQLLIMNGRRKLAQDMEYKILKILDDLRNEKISIRKIKEDHYHTICGIMDVNEHSRNIHQNIVFDLLTECEWYEMCSKENEKELINEKN